MIEKYDQKIKRKEELKNQEKWINLIGLVREYYKQLNKLHNSFRQITPGFFEDALGNLAEVRSKYYNKDAVSQIGFYGDGKELEDFLVQYSYVDKIMKYRSKESFIDEMRYYIDKISFIDERKWKVSNSARCHIRYNM